MTSAYRENDAPDIDKTEVAKERVRQDGETKRKLIEEREETRRKAMGSESAYAYNWRNLFGAGVAIAGIIAVAVTVNSYFDVKKTQATTITDGLCRDEFLAFGSTGVVMSCNHPNQVAEPRGDNRLFCKCSAPTPAPSASTAP
jgi:hypothetical protein